MHLIYFLFILKDIYALMYTLGEKTLQGYIYPKKIMVFYVRLVIKYSTIL